MILMRRLCDFIRRIFTLSRSVGRVDFKVEEPAKEPAKEPVKEPAKETVDLQDYGNPFLNLPNELLLAVAHFLDKEFQALLSLSCTRLRVLFNSYLDLSLNDISVKLRFLRYLERDYPDHLICRSCGFLFNWQLKHSYHFRCPRAYHHSFEERSKSRAWLLKGGQQCLVSREVIDLIFRAHERGQRYGLPLSFLSSSMSDRNWITRTNEARLVDGQLLLASCWELDLDSRQDMLRKAHLFNSALCIHSTRNAGSEKVWQTIEKAVAEKTGLEKPRVFKCPFCALDYSLDVQNRVRGRMKIVLNVYRNFGQRYAKTLASEQLFYCDSSSSRIDADELLRRNLHVLFCRTVESFGTAKTITNTSLHANQQQIKDSTYLE